MTIVDENKLLKAIEKGAENATLILSKEWLSMEEVQKYMGRTQGYVQRFIDENSIRSTRLYSTQKGGVFLYSKKSIEQTLERLSKSRGSR